MLDTESLNSLQSLQQLDVRYVQFSTLQANTSCALADYHKSKTNVRFNCLFTIMKMLIVIVY